MFPCVANVHVCRAVVNPYNYGRAWSGFVLCQNFFIVVAIRVAIAA